jgi:hypothetical protein
MVEMTLEEWQAEAKRRFGSDPLAWRFVCPSCGHVASVADYKAAGAPEGAVGFSCVGRWTNAKREAFSKSKRKGPCNYAGGGLFRLNPVRVTKPDGESLDVFAFDVA